MTAKGGKARHRWAAGECKHCGLTMRREVTTGTVRRLITFPGTTRWHRVPSRDWPRCGETGVAWAKRIDLWTERRSRFVGHQNRKQRGKLANKRRHYAAAYAR